MRGSPIEIHLPELITHSRTVDSNTPLGDLYETLTHNEIAEVIPDTATRYAITKQFKKGMDLQGFQFGQFFDFQAAIEWFSD